MYSRIFHITGNDLQQPVESFVRKHHQQAHESVYTHGLIRLYEDYSFLNGNNLMVCIRVDSSAAAAGKITIEFIAGGASEGLLAVDNMWGSEKRRAGKFNDDLADFCKDNHFELQVEEPHQ